MLIRSQDKKKIVNLCQIKTLYIENSYIYIDNYTLPLAQYKSEEDAIKVLDSICRAHIDNCKIFTMPQMEEIG